MHTVKHTAGNGTISTYYARKGLASAHRIGRTCLRTQQGSYTIECPAKDNRTILGPFTLAKEYDNAKV